MAASLVGQQKMPRRGEAIAKLKAFVIGLAPFGKTQGFCRSGAGLAREVGHHVPGPLSPSQPLRLRRRLAPSLQVTRSHEAKAESSGGGMEEERQEWAGVSNFPMHQAFPVASLPRTCSPQPGEICPIH